MGDVGRWGTPHGRPEGSPPISKGQEDSHMTVNNVCGVHVPMAWLWDADDRVRQWSTNGHASLAASLDCSQTQPC